MSQPSTITIEQLRRREINAADLLRAEPSAAGSRPSALTVPSAPLSVFGRKVIGHDR